MLVSCKPFLICLFEPSRSPFFTTKPPGRSFLRIFLTLASSDFLFGTPFFSVGFRVGLLLFLPALGPPNDVFVPFRKIVTKQLILSEVRMPFSLSPSSPSQGSP